MNLLYWVTQVAAETLIPKIVADLGIQSVVTTRILDAEWSDEEGGHSFGTCSAHARITLYPNRIWHYVGRDTVKFLQQLYNTIAHELRHAWQYEQGIPYDWDLPYWDRPSEQDARSYSKSVQDKFTPDTNLIVRRARVLHRATKAARQPSNNNPVVAALIEERRWVRDNWRYWRDEVQAKTKGNSLMTDMPELQRLVALQGIPP